MSMLRIAPAEWCSRSYFLAVIVLMALLLTRGRNLSFGGLVECQTKGGGDARAIGGIGLGAIGDMALLDFETRVTQGAGGVLEQKLLLLATHLPEQVARLLVVIVLDAMVPPGRVALERQRRLHQGRV